MYRLVEQKPERVLRYILYLQLVLWTLIPAFTYASAPIDVMENIGWGRAWQLGYYKHPPLQAWLTYGAFMLGNGRMWPVYALSQLCVVATQLGVFSLTRDIAGAKRALWAVALFSITYYATLPSPEFNTNILQMPLWIWAAVALRRAILTGRARWWLALAAALAAALYAKYSVAVLVGALAAALMARPDGRASLKTPWPWAAVAICLAICGPQLWWLWSVDFLPLRFTEIRNHAPGLLERLHDIGAFMVGQMLDFSVAALVLLIAGARGAPAEPGKADDRRYVLALTAAAYGLMVIASLFSTVRLRDMWGAPVAAFVAVTVMVVLDPDAAKRRAKLALTLAAAVFLVAPIATGFAASYGGYRAKPPKIAFPAPGVAQSLDEIWQQQTETPLDIVAGRTWPASLVASYSRDRPSVFVDGNWRYNPWITRERVAKRGMLVVWQEDGDPPPQLQALGPFQARGRVLVRYKRGGKMAAFNWAIRAPGLPAPAGSP